MTRETRKLASLPAVAVGAWLAGPADAQHVTPERIVRAARESQNWLTYSGTYASQRYSALRQITPQNVSNLEQQWVLQGQTLGAWQSSPLVVDGILYLTQRPNEVLALDAKTGRVFWQYRYLNSADQRVCCGANNRGLAIHGDTLFMGTLDAHLVAIDAKNGQPLWKTTVADSKLAYSVTMAPLVIKDLVLVGTGGGEYGIRGFVAAYDVRSGEERWRFNAIPSPGEPGSETWSGDDWEHGGASVWVTGSYDPELNLTYWGIGNPGPDWNPEQRPGDNLYSDSVVALDADTGKLTWHFQFTPNDAYDYDAVQVPVLVDLPWQGRSRKLMLWANRNGFFYVLDRATGEFLAGTPFVKVNWASGLDANGRPIPTPQPPGAPTWPGNQGGTNWYSPSFSPRTELFYLSAWVDYASYFRREPQEFEVGRNYAGGGHRIGDQDRPRGRLRADHRADRGGRQVVAVDDEAGKKAILAELLPQQVRVARQRARAAIAQMGRERGPGRHGVLDLGSVRSRMADRHAHTGRNQVLDERERAGYLGGERHESDATLGGVLAAVEVVHRGAAHVLARVCPARPVLGCDVGPLHVDACDRRMTRAHERAGAGGEGLERRRDQRGQEARDPGFPDRRHGAAQVAGRGGRVAEVDAREAVDLQVDEARELQRARTGAGRRPRVRVAAAEPENRAGGRGAREEPAARRKGGVHAADRAT